MAKAYAKQYKKYYTNILYVEYTGDLHQSVTDMDFTDDLPEDSEEERFRKHNRFLRSLKDDTLGNAHLVSNLHANLGGLYRMNGQTELAKEHMEKGLLLLDQYHLLYTTVSLPQLINYAALLTEMQEPERALSALQKLAQIIKHYNSDHCLDYAQVQESMGYLSLITANLSQAKSHFKKAMKISEDVWAAEPELIEAKSLEIQHLSPQVGIALAKGILTSNINRHNFRILFFHFAKAGWYPK